MVVGLMAYMGQGTHAGWLGTLHTSSRCRAVMSEEKTCLQVLAWGGSYKAQEAVVQEV